MNSWAARGRPGSVIAGSADLAVCNELGSTKPEGETYHEGTSGTSRMGQNDS